MKLERENASMLDMEDSAEHEGDVGVPCSTGVDTHDVQFALQQLETHSAKLSEAYRRIEALELLVDSIQRRAGDGCSEDCGEGEAQMHSAPEPERPRLSMTVESWSYQLQNSVWEATLLVGSGTGLITNVSVLVGFLMNAVVQLLFCAVAIAAFTDEKFPEVADVENWRYSVAHDEAWADPSTGASLASMVCRIDNSISVATNQRDLVYEIEQYTDLLLDVPQGALLSMLAIVMWFLVVVAENWLHVGRLHDLHLWSTTRVPEDFQEHVAAASPCISILKCATLHASLSKRHRFFFFSDVFDAHRNMSPLRD